MAKKVSKNQTAGMSKDTQVKYSDPRMAYMSTKSELVLKESEKLVMKDIFGEDILSKNNPIMLCEDQNGLYLTSKSNVDCPLLDGYRMYQRNKYEILKEGEDTYKIKVGEKVFEF